MLDTLPKDILKKVERVVDKIDKCKDTKGSFTLAKQVLKDWGLDVENPRRPAETSHNPPTRRRPGAGW